MERQRLQYLLLQYTNDRATVSEMEELNQLDIQSEENKALLTELAAEGFAAHQDPGFDSSRYMDLSLKAVQIDKTSALEADLQSAAADLSLPPATRVHFLRTHWFRYAAVLLLIAATAAFLYNRNGVKKEIAKTSAVEHADILPGGNKAVLTLGDGSRIVLDSAANGNITNQGNTKVVKLNAGALAYEAGGPDDEVLNNTINTPKGGLYQVVLPDGTKVWLNAASSVTFPTAFHKDRRVTITGEAYLEVAKDKTKPFTVTANGTVVEVLGTGFNINAYKDEAAVKTSLIEGSIKVSKDGGLATVLKPGEQYAVINGRPSLTANADIEQILAWKNGAFYFKHTGLADAMRQISRWYNVEVVYENGIPDIFLGGEIKRDLTLSQMLDGLVEMGLRFRIEKTRLIVMNDSTIK